MITMKLEVLRGEIEARRIVAKRRFAAMTAEERDAIELKAFREGDVIDPGEWHVSYPRLLALVYDDRVDVTGLDQTEREALDRDLDYFRESVAPMRQEGKDIRSWYLQPPTELELQFYHLAAIPPPPAVRRAAGAGGPD